MPICKPSHNKCYWGNMEQDEQEFRDEKGKPTLLCRTCRERSRQYNKKFREGLNNDREEKFVIRHDTHNLKPGDPPKFADKTHKEMNKRWWRKIAKEVDGS